MTIRQGADLTPVARPYKVTSVFDERSLPEAIRKEHRTKAGTWGLLRILEGVATLVFTDDHREVEVTASRPAQIPPQETHFVRLGGPVRMQVEFYREPPLDGAGMSDGQ